MTVRSSYWCCPNCELAVPDSQASCGGCGHAATSDRAHLSIGELQAFTADAALFRPPRKPKAPKRRRR